MVILLIIINNIMNIIPLIFIIFRFCFLFLKFIFVGIYLHIFEFVYLRWV